MAAELSSVVARGRSTSSTRSRATGILVRMAGQDPMREAMIDVMIADPASTVDVISVVATVCAVLVALFGAPVWQWWRRPILKIGADDGAGRRLVCQDKGDGMIDFRCWLRLPVTNVGRSTAEDVMVLLTRVNTPQRIHQQPPARELKWADVPADRLSLPPAVSRLVDVMNFARISGNGEYREGLLAGLMPLGNWDHVSPNSPLWMDASPGTYVFHVCLAARDVRARSAVITVDLQRSLTLEEARRALSNVEIRLGR
jgi:hypothetical protein